MSTVFTWGSDALEFDLTWSDTQPVFLSRLRAHGQSLAFTGEVPLVEILTAGHGHVLASNRLISTRAGAALRYLSHSARTVEGWSFLDVTTESEDGIRAVLHLSVPNGVAAFRSSVTVTNINRERPIALHSVASWASSFGYTGSSPLGVEAWTLLEGHNDWLGEGRWRHIDMRSGLFPALSQGLTGHSPRGAHSLASTGTWSSGRFQPVGAAFSEAESIAWMWQIEHNGAWRWEVGENSAEGYFALSGPTDIDHQWSQALAPAQSFTTVPVSLAVGSRLEAALAELTAYRRAARRAHPDNAAMPVVFNDYMNTLNGNPTTAKLLPLIDAAASAGAEVFCIDAGWYDDGGDWWDSVGEWRHSTSRFPGGLESVLDRIRELGMIPGLWLEPEVVGTRSTVADSLPPEAFLQRHGERVVEQGRFHLDLSHPAAIAHLNAVVDRLVEDFGVGYFKLDYNINPGAGTDLNTSVGAGLLEHNRAHLEWLDALLERHPSLILENCASGAMRSDFAMLSRVQLQSTSDQQDPLKFPPIAASAPLSCLPEQAANWAYPQPEMSPEESAFTLATSVLGRFYFSGHIGSLTPSQSALVADAVSSHKRVRESIRTSSAFWPNGLPAWDDPWVVLGLATQSSRLITIWNRSPDEQDLTLNFPDLIDADVVVRVVFPTQLTAWATTWNAASGTLTVRNTTRLVSARTFELVKVVQ